MKGSERDGGSQVRVGLIWAPRWHKQRLGSQGFQQWDLVESNRVIAFWRWLL